MKENIGRLLYVSHTHTAFPGTYLIIGFRDDFDGHHSGRRYVIDRHWYPQQKKSYESCVSVTFLNLNPEIISFVDGLDI